MSNLELGAGLIGIGRTWGHKETPVPTEQEAETFLRSAFELGITYYDTAPSYGSSEERLGQFLSTLTPAQREQITVATKFGEHWNFETNTPYTDHSFDALAKSIDQSVERLGKIDVLLVHKSTPEVLKSDDMKKALEYARRQGITSFGASVSDIESGRIICEDDRYSTAQLPFNQQNQNLSEILDLAQKKGKTVIINRPFNMGGILYEVGKELSPEEQRVEAYRFIARRVTTHGIVLTGTKSPNHLKDNMDAFKAALT